jgi:ribosomal protein S18 acetylase RimI-like enzyme
MVETSLHWTEDLWLSGVLGVQTWSCHVEEDSVRKIEGSLAEFRPLRDAFATVKLPIGDTQVAPLFMEYGFSLVDVAVTLDRSQAEPAAMPDNVRLATEADFDAVESIAEHSFRYSRFHQDPRIGLQRANKVKRSWMQSYRTGSRGEETIIVEQHGEVAGFLGVLLQSRTAVIDLIAVDPAFSGRGLGRSLVRGFISRWSEDADRLLVGTQLINIPSIRLYESQGFRMADAQKVLHGHWNNGEWKK